MKRRSSRSAACSRRTPKFAGEFAGEFAGGSGSRRRSGPETDPARAAYGRRYRASPRRGGRAIADRSIAWLRTQRRGRPSPAARGAIRTLARGPRRHWRSLQPQRRGVRCRRSHGPRPEDLECWPLAPWRATTEALPKGSGTSADSARIRRPLRSATLRRGFTDVPSPPRPAGAQPPSPAAGIAVALPRGPLPPDLFSVARAAPSRAPSPWPFRSARCGPSQPTS